MEGSVAAQAAMGTKYADCELLEFKGRYYPGP